VEGEVEQRDAGEDRADRRAEEDEDQDGGDEGPGQRQGATMPNTPRTPSGNRASAAASASQARVARRPCVRSIRIACTSASSPKPTGKAEAFQSRFSSIPGDTTSPSCRAYCARMAVSAA
jgi:hypothetical protein